MTFRWKRLGLPLVIGSVAACSAGADEDGDDPEPIPLVGAPGVTLQQVAIYQSLKRTLMLNGTPQGSNIPLVAGRDAMVRLYYATDPAYDGQPVTGRLRLAGQAPLEATTTLAPVSVEEDLATTVNITVPGALIGPTLDYSVTLGQDGTSRDDNPNANYPQGGATEPVAVDGPQNKLRVILAPFAYHADGSGRLPNTSPEQVEVIRQRFRGMYPVSDVEVTVREPQPWNIPIDPHSNAGWTDMGIEVFGYRGNDGAGDDVYYYGLFNPGASLQTYCGGSCILGMTLINADPPDVGAVGLRMALGVGFDFVAADTAVHEVGHSHGLLHAPCGPGLDPGSIDYEYPHAGGGIGVWGYDPLVGTLLAPTFYNDMMGYCDNLWISDYHYNKLLARGGNVNLPDWQPPSEGPLAYQLITIDGRGDGTFRSVAERGRPLAGKPIRTTTRSATGVTAEREARYFAYDHFPGGWLFVPVDDERLDRVEVTVDGRQVVATR